MPLNLSRGDRKLLIGAGVLFVLASAGMAFFQPKDDERERFPSTYSVKSGGAKATFKFIESLGYKIERWEQSPQDLPQDSEGVVLIMAAPVHEPDRRERLLVQKFLESGGTVIAAGGLSEGFLPHAVGRWFPEKSWTTYKALSPSDITRVVPAITLRKSRGWDGDTPVTPLYGTQDVMTAVTYQVGKGHIFWISSEDPLTNAGLKARGNAPFIAAMLASVNTQRVLWDLYYNEDRRNEVSSFAAPPLYWGGVQLLFVLSLGMFTYSRRFGPIRPVPSLSRLSPLEFVDALGNLYRQRKATHVAVDVAYRRFRNLANRRLALPSNATLEQVARAAHVRVGRSEEEILAVLTSCDSARYGSEMQTAEAVTLCNELNHYLTELKLVAEEKTS